ncbi:MAG: hypothetical protein NT154_33995 [Verrucomicrobia bacterium]|nr:hypothetical protein [Verrucomicrobiota bacterium]
MSGSTRGARPKPPSRREDCLDGKIVLDAETTAGPNLMITAVALMPLLHSAFAPRWRWGGFALAITSGQEQRGAHRGPGRKAEAGGTQGLSWGVGNNTLVVS